MAKDKKEFKIVINGLSESIDAVKTLNKELNELDDKLKSLQNAKIQIKVQGNTPDTTKQKVSGGTATDSETQKQTQQQNALAKLQQQLAQQRAKNEALVTEEYQKQYQELQKIKDANKEAEQIQKQIATGVRDANGEYSNTLQGQRAYLSELQKTFNSQKMGTEEWRKAADELLRVRELVKSIEQSTGDYRRNVGNYPSGAKELVQLFKEYKQQIDEANASLNELKESMKGMAEGSDEYKAAVVQVQELEEKLNEATEASQNLNDELGKKIQINVGGQVQFYDSLKNAAKELTGQLQKLYIEGKAGSKEFDNTIKALGRVKTAMSNVSSEVSSFVGNAKGLKDTVTIMNGLTSIASIGVGLQGLFGGQNAELDEGLKKFTQLTLIMNGLSNLQKQMNDETDIFGGMLSKAWKSAQNLTSGLDGFISSVDRTRQAMKIAGGDIKTFTDNFQQNLTNSIANAPQIVQQSFQRMISEIQTFEQTYNRSLTFADLFGTDDDKLKEKFGDALGGAIEDFKSQLKQANMDDVTQQMEDFSEIVNLTSGSVNGLSQSMAQGNKMAKVFAVGLNYAAKAFKAFLSSTLILAAVAAAMWVLQKAVEGVTYAFNKLTGNDTAKLVENFDGLAASIQNATDKLEQLNKETDRKVAEETINSYQALKEKLDNVTRSATQAGNSLKQFVAEMSNTQDINFDEGFESDAWFNSDATVKNMRDFEKRYKLLTKAVLQGVDEVKAATGSGDWWLTAGDAKTDLANMQKGLIGQLQNEINKIDFSKGEESFKQFINLINNELYASALSNIDELFPEDKWQQGLKQRIDAYRNFAEQMYSLNTQMATQTAAMAKQIQDNLNAAIADPYERANAQRKTAMQRELEDAEGNAELQESIRKKYQREEADAAKAHRKQMEADAKAARQKALQNQYTAMQAEIDLMQDGLEKQKKILELQKKQAVDAAKEQGASKATIAKIVENYNRQILKLEITFTRDIEKLYKTRNQTLLELELEYLAQLKEVDRSIWDRQQEIKKQLEDFAQEDWEFELNFEITNNPPIEKYVNDLVGYYRNLTSAQEQYYERKKKLEIESENETYQRNEDDEYERLQERQRYYSQWLDEQNETLRQALEDGLITQQQYEEMEKENHDKANEYLADETQRYINNIQQMEEDHNQRLLEIERTYQENKRQAVKEGLDNIIDTYSEYYQAIEQTGERNTKNNTSELGIINFAKERQNLKNMQNQYKDLMKNIEQEYKDLQDKFDNNEISFNDFRLAKKELDGLVVSINDKYKDVSKNLKNLFNTVVQSVMQATQQYVQAFSQMWSMISSLIEANLDEEEKRLEREQELLEEEYDMLEEQYNKQEELEKKHTDKINSIEDELKSARGDRREYLIDALAKERDAQIKALATEQEIQKEKENNQKKQEQIEKQNEALEKKRWEQNKRNQIVQATINTFTAVTNALAVQPWFVGLALSAVALGLGMANVAKIKAQKYYADGGLLTGKSHNQGGIKIPGTNIEVEGNEYVVNKTTTKYNQPLIEYINSKRRPITKDDLVNFYDDGKNRLINKNLTNKFADGGQLPTMQDIDVRDLVNYTPQTDDRPIYVAVTDIMNATENVQRVRVLAGVK